MSNDTGTDARGHDVEIISRDEYKRLKDCEEHLEWLVNLHHGVSKGYISYYLLLIVCLLFIAYNYNPRYSCNSSWGLELVIIHPAYVSAPAHSSPVVARWCLASMCWLIPIGLTLLPQNGQGIFTALLSRRPRS